MLLLVLLLFPRVSLCISLPRVVRQVMNPMQCKLANSELGIPSGTHRHPLLLPSLCHVLDNPMLVPVHGTMCACNRYYC